jgi:hypothetical protein
MHFSLSTINAPVSLLQLKAPDGQTFKQAAASHCRHIIGTEIPSDSHVRTLMRETLGRNSFS